MKTYIQIKGHILEIRISSQKQLILNQEYILINLRLTSEWRQKLFSILCFVTNFLFIANFLSIHLKMKTTHTYFK